MEDAAHREVPEELFWLIFSFLPSHDHKSWKPLSLVNRSWRKATLSCPHFRFDLSSWSPSQRVKRLQDEHLIQHSKLIQTMNLSEINLDLCVSLTPAVLRALAGSACAKSVLRRVRFAHCKDMVTDESLRTFVISCFQLEDLTLIDLPRLRQCFKAIFVDGTTAGQNLRSLSIRHCAIDTEDVTEFAAKTGPAGAAGNLTALDLSCTGIKKWGLVVKLTQWMPKLRSLNLSGCDALKKVSFAAVGNSCPDLETLILRRLDRSIKEKTPGDIANSLPRLRILDLADSPGLSSYKLLAALGTCCPLLEELYLQGGSNLGFPTAVVTNCKNLVALDVRRMLNNKDNDIKLLIENAGPRIRYFGVGDSGHVTWAVLKELVERCPKLEVLKMARLRSVPETWDPLPLHKKASVVVQDESIAGLYGELERLATARTGAATQYWMVDKMEPFLELATEHFGELPPQFLEFCRLWGGRFPIQGNDMTFMSDILHDGSVADSESFILLNEYGNNDTVWYSVLDVTGAIGPKGSVLDFSVWDTYYTNGGYSDSFVKEHMGPNTNNKDSEPFIFPDFQSFLKLLVKKAKDDVTDYVWNQFRSSVTYYNPPYVVEEAFKLVEIDRLDSDGNNLLAMALKWAVRTEDKDLAKHYIKVLLELGLDPAWRNHLGESSLDIAAQQNMLEYILV